MNQYVTVHLKRGGRVYTFSFLKETSIRSLSSSLSLEPGERLSLHFYLNPQPHELLGELLCFSFNSSLVIVVV